MGDHRASVKIEFDFHGKVHKMDSWINWTPWADSAECEGVDDRVVEFFREATREGMATYHEALYALEAREKRTEMEKREREELARLKAKYPDAASGANPL